MKKLLVPLFACAALSVASSAFAGGSSDCHFHGSTPAKQETVAGCAVKQQQSLITSGKLDRSWQDVKPGAPEEITGQKGKEWKVTFKHPAAADKSKETLFMFFTHQGNFIAANFSGK